MNQNSLHGTRFMRTLSLSLLLSATVAAAPSLAAEARGVALRDEVLVDTARSVAYTMHPEGGVEAIDLQRGLSLWRSSAAERPLALNGGLLVAQARPGAQGELRIVALDVLHDGAASAEADLPMPAGIRADYAETLRHSYRASATVTAEGVVIDWQYEPRPSLPNRMREVRGEEEEKEREMEGEQEREGKLAANARGAEARSGHALFDLQAGRLLPLAPEKALRLSATRPGIQVLSAPLAEARRFASIDGRHILTSRRVSGLSTTTPNPYRWTITEAESGRELGTVEARYSVSPFLVAGGQVIHVAQPRVRIEGKNKLEQALRLRAVDLTTGLEVWSRDLRDTRFSGSAAE
jgi:hypothetical protein